VAKLILLVHTDAEVRAEVAAALCLAGYDVVAYSDTMSAMKALEGDRRPDLLITRTRYPEGSPTGISLARMAKMKCPWIKVVITGAPELAEYAEGVGVFHPNPIDVPRLVATAERLLTGGQGGAIERHKEIPAQDI
jgi:DNA-binding NtrC family response regulator